MIETNPYLHKFQTELEFWPWFGGFFDGEGCIYFKERRPMRGKNKTYYQPELQIVVGQSGEHGYLLLEAIAEITGISSVKNSYTGSTISKQPAYLWRTSGKKALILLRQLRPYLIHKTEKADIAIQFMGNHFGI